MAEEWEKVNSICILVLFVQISRHPLLVLEISSCAWPEQVFLCLRSHYSYLG